MRPTLRGAAFLFFAAVGALGSGCGGGGNSGGGGGSQDPITPIVTVSPASSTVTTAQALKVTVSVSGGSGTPTGSVTLSAGSYTSPASALSGGVASVTIAPGSLASGNVTLIASYKPDLASSSAYNGASGTTPVAVSLATPTVNVTPASQSIIIGQELQVAVTLSAGTGAPTATGSVTLSGAGYNSAAVTLSAGSAGIRAHV